MKKNYFYDPIKFLEWYIQKHKLEISLDVLIEQYNNNLDYKNQVDLAMQQENSKRKSNYKKGGSAAISSILKNNPNHQSKAAKNIKPESRSKAGKAGGPIGGKISGQKHKESGHISALGKEFGTKNLTDWQKENPEEFKKQSSKNGKISGQKNKESGHISALGKKYARQNVLKFNAENPEKAYAIRSKAGKANGEKLKRLKREAALQFYNLIQTNDWFTLSDVGHFAAQVEYSKDAPDPKRPAYRYLKDNKDLFEEIKGKVNGKSVNLFKKLVG